jgi:hypothetical protein
VREGCFFSRAEKHSANGHRSGILTIGRACVNFVTSCKSFWFDKLYFAGIPQGMDELLLLLLLLLLLIIIIQAGYPTQGFEETH